MIKIRILTTLRNQKHFDSVVSSGTEKYVDDEYARELVEDKGFAEYVEESAKMQSTAQGEFPEGFLQESIPEGFPDDNIHGILKDSEIHTFEALLHYDNFQNINGIGPKYSKELQDSLEVALEDWKRKNK